MGAILRLLRFLLLQLIRHILVLPVLEDLGEKLHTLGSQQANGVDQCADSTSGVRSTTEAKEEDLVSRLPIVAEETVAFTDMTGNGEAGCTTDNFVNQAAVCAYTIVIVDNLGMQRLLRAVGQSTRVQGPTDARDVGRERGCCTAGKDTREEFLDA